MKRNEEREEERLGLRLRIGEVVPAEEAGEENGVPQTRDRKQLSDPLKESHHDRLEIGNQFLHPKFFASCAERSTACALSALLRVTETFPHDSAYFLTYR